MNTVTKDPDAVLNYGHDWADGGANDGSTADTGWLQSDTVATSTWSVEGPDALLVVDSDSNDATTTTVVLSGGTLNKGDYLVTNHIITAAGYEEDRTIVVRMVEK